jgi:putative endonuclease
MREQVANAQEILRHPGEGRDTRPATWPEVPPLLYDPTTQNAWVYIIANKPNGIIYIGITNNLPLRCLQHQQGQTEGFTKKFGCKTLVYFEGYERITDAIAREKAMKEWPRSRKIRYILAVNPQWSDLYEQLA